MDDSRFDALARSLVSVGSRRHALGGFLASVLALVGSRTDEVSAKNCKKIQNKAKRKKCLAKAKTLSCPAGQRPCRGACLSVLICCDDTDCAGGRTCQQGTCACPADKPHDDCPGSTVCQQCCTVDDCRPDSRIDGQVCQNGQCVCTRAGTRRCPSDSSFPGLCGACCTNGECPEAQVCTFDGGLSSPYCRCFSDRCDVNGQQICVPPGCADKCITPCNVPGQPQAGQPCCTGKGAFVCFELSQGDFRCAPPEWQ
jgi:hypothetical protein